MLRFILLASPSRQACFVTNPSAFVQTGIVNQVERTRGYNYCCVFANARSEFIILVSELECHIMFQINNAAKSHGYSMRH